MLIVDSQVHIWGANTPERPWPADGIGRAQKPYPVTKELILQGMNEAGVDRVVLVPPSWEGDRNDLACEAAALHPDRFAVMGRIDVSDPASRGLIAGWKEQPGMLGIRLTFHIERHIAALKDGSVDWLWSEAEKAGLPLMVFVPGIAPLIAPVAERHPGLKLIIDHLAIHGDPGEVRFAQLPEVLALSRFPNVAVKASALPCFTTERYPFLGLHGYIRQVYDTFGPRRMFWGTDWTRLPCSWREAIDLFTRELSWLSGEDKTWIMGRGICEWIGWPLPE